MTPDFKPWPISLLTSIRFERQKSSKAPFPYKLDWSTISDASFTTTDVRVKSGHEQEIEVMKNLSKVSRREFAALAAAGLSLAAPSRVFPGPRKTVLPNRPSPRTTRGATCSTAMRVS